jgi:RHS repeat-associated protein
MHLIYTRTLFLLCLLLISASSLAKDPNKTDVGCALDGPTSVNRYTSATYTMNGSTCTNAVSWSTTCGSIVVDSETPTSVRIYFGSSCSTATIKAFNGSGGTIATVNVTIAGVPALTGGSISNTSQTINYNATPALLVCSSPSNGACESYEFQWFSSSDNSTFIAIAGATSQNYQSTNLTATTYFKRLVTCDYQTAYSNTATVTVYPAITAGTISPSTQTINYNTTPSSLTCTAATGGSGSYSYQWQSSPSSGGTYTDIQGATLLTYAPAALMTPTYYRVKITSNGTSVLSNFATVTVYPQLAGGSVSPASSSVYYNASPGTLTSTGVAGGNGIYSYQWQSSPNGSTWTNISGATSVTYSPGNLTAPTYYRVVVTSNGVTAPSSPGSVTLYTALSPGSVTPATSNIAYGTSPGILMYGGASGGSGSYTYQWQISSNGSTWSNIQGATSYAYGVENLTANTYYRVNVTSAGLTVPTAAAIVYVLQPGAVSPSSIAINYNTNAGQLSLTGVSGSTGSYSYQWQSATSADFASPTNISGATSATYTPGNLITTTYYRVAVTANGFTAYSGYCTTTVYSELVAGSISPATQIVNYNTLPTSLTLSGVSGGSGTYTYEWQSSASPLGPFIATGTTGTIHTLDDPATSLMYYRVVVTSNGATATTDNAVVNVWPELISGTITPANQQINYNTIPASLTCTAATGGNDHYSYQWQSSSNAITGYSDITGETSLTYTATTPLTSTKYYRLATRSNGAVDYSDYATVHVFPELVVGNLTPALQNLNYDVVPAMLTLPSLAGGTGTYEYEWQRSASGNFTDAEVVGNDPTFNPPVNTRAYYRVIVTSDGVSKTSGVARVFTYAKLYAGTLDPAEQWVVFGDPAMMLFDDGVTGGNGIYKFEWYSSEDGETWLRIPVSLANKRSFAPGVLEGTAYFQLFITSNGVTVSTNIAVVHLVPSVDPGRITTIPRAVDMGMDAGLLVATPATDGPCPTYQYAWEKSTDGENFSDTGIITENYSAGTLNVTTWFRRKVNCGYQTAYTNVVQVNVGAFASITDINYVKTHEALVGGITTDTDLNANSNVDMVRQSTQFIDGLGRPIQTVIWEGSPQQTDLVSLAEYDQYNRESFQYLPYTSSASQTGDLKTTPYSDQFNFNSVQFTNEQYYFGRTLFEESPDNRVVKQLAPGTSWMGAGRGNSSEYHFNTTSDNIRQWTIASTAGSIPVSQSAYASGTLFKTSSSDEEGHKVIEFKDKFGHVILKKVQTVQSPGISYDGWACTYYVYDEYGNLRFVLQPEGVEAIKTTWVISPDIAESYSFQYIYDTRKRMTQKQVPGADAVYMVYDDRDRLVLTQDGNQRSVSPYKWLFTKYDVLNRPVLTGIKDTTVSLSQSEMQAVVNNFYAKAWPRLYEGYVGTSAGNIHGYTNKSYPVVTTGNLTVANSYLTVTYYDNYDFKSLLWGSYDYASDGLTETRSGIPYTQSVTYNSMIKGLVTGSKVRVLDNNVAAGNNWLSTVNYYDDKYRMIQTISDNYKGGFDKISTLYDFTSKVLENKQTHYGLSFKSLVAAQNYANKVRTTSTAGGWGSAGAASVEMLPANQDGWIEFKAASSTHALMVGLADTNPNATWTSIDYALYLPTDGYLQIRENGSTNVLSPSPQYFAGDVFRIERKGTQINYYQNGLLLRTKTVSAGLALMVDIALNTVGAEVHGLRSSFGSATAYTINRRYEYDAGSRLTHVWHQINSNPEILLTKNEYNELGQLIDKKLHSTQADASDAHQSVDYRYNIRGWLTSMNNASLANDGTNDDSNDLFGFNLSYNDVSDLGNSPLFNGNISAMKWSNNLGLGELKEKGYTYGYDPLNRIASSNYKTKNVSWTAPTNNGFSETGYSYDLNGNMLSLTRYDNRTDGAPMDLLSYDYGTVKSNKLMKVTDTGDDFKGFVDGTNSSDDYTYDGNGNMITDQNKGITTNIIYNHLNLPITISKGFNTINYVYDAMGRKLSQITSYGTAWSSETDYIGEFQYQNHRLQFINHEEGRVTLSETETVGTYNGESTSGVTVQGTAALTLVTQNGTEKYLRVASTGSTSTSGAFPIIGGISVVQGEQYLLRVKGYRTGSSAVYLIGKVNGTQVLTGSRLPGNTAISESWTEQQITIPANGTLQVGVIWSTVTSGQQFFVNEMEVIKLTTIAPEYQYNLKDHLGNVRLTFTTKPETENTTATYETAQDGNYLRYDNARKVYSKFFDKTNGSADGYAQRLSGGLNEKYGIGRSISVMPGDKITAEVYAKYVDSNSENRTPELNTLISQIASQIAAGTTTSGLVIDGTSFTSSTATFPFPTEANTNTAGSSEAGPKAYLNWLVFDKDYKLITAKSGFDRLSVDAKETGTDTDHERLFSPEIVIDQPGYVYLYISNEESTPIDVYFDDFKVEHEKSAVIAMDDYYPFGLTFNSYSRESSLPNMYQYNGKEKQDELGLDWLDYGARMYQPEIGRFFRVDGMAESYYSVSPYIFALDNPVAFKDPDGNFTIGVHSKLTSDALKKFGYSEDTQDLLSHYASVYADNPKRWIRVASFMYKRGDIDYSETANSQDTSSPTESTRHSMEGDHEHIGYFAANRRGQEFGWKKIFEAAKQGKVDSYKKNSKGAKAFGVGLHALQDSKVHNGTKFAKHDHLADFGGNVAEDQAKNITESALIVIEVLNGDFSNLKDGMELDISGMGRDELGTLIQSLLKSDAKDVKLWNKSKRDSDKYGSEFGSATNLDNYR